MNRFSSLRYRLLALVLIPLLLLSGTVMFLAYQWSSDYTYRQLFAKVNTDLSVASDAFASIEARAQQQLHAFGNSTRLSAALDKLQWIAESSEEDLKSLNDLLDSQMQLGDFDYLNLLSGNALQKMGESGWQSHGFRHSTLSEAMLMSREQTTLSGIEIYESQDWQGQPDLNTDRIALPLISTPRAIPTSRTDEERAMLIRVLQSLYDNAGNRIAILEAGLLLNKNFEFVDGIRALVYGPGSLAPGSRGTVTVFLGDTRITTNVILEDGSRALGTRVSAEVRDAVLGRGETWVDRAFVVNDWYISAYEPILDVGGERVGMLYAGYLEKPFRQQLIKAIAVLSAVVLTGSLAAAAAAVWGARSIFSPVERITSVVRATSRGEHQRIGSMLTGNEIGELAVQFDAMLDSLDLHRQQIERNSQLLEVKVQQRTQELERQNQRLQDSISLLQKTRQQLHAAEKLAALGEFTAGVAHEINNPTAVILGNMDVLISDLGNRASEFTVETELIIEQVYRIRTITDALLQYSRSAQEQHNKRSERIDYRDAVTNARSTGPIQLAAEGALRSTSLTDIDKLIGDTIKLLEHELRGRAIVIEVDNKTSLKAEIDQLEFQQVLINLVSNAIQAIEKNGEITISACNYSQRAIFLTVRDSGKGIAPENIDRVFDPFFTEGKAHGTGLGLAVSFGIIRRHGGDITVVSEVSKGSEFSVTLPAV